MSAMPGRPSNGIPMMDGLLTPSASTWLRPEEAVM